MSKGCLQDKKDTFKPNTLCKMDHEAEIHKKFVVIAEKEILKITFKVA